MSTQDNVKGLVESIQSNPDFLAHLAQHPYSAMRETTGREDISRDEVSEAMAALATLMGGQSVDFGKIGGVASGMLADNGGSAHSMAESLFGGLLGGVGGQSGAQVGFPSDILSNLAHIDFAKGMAGVDLSDGLGLDDVVGFAKGMLK